MDRLTACLILRLLPGIGPITAQKLVYAYGSPEAIFDSQTQQTVKPSPYLVYILKQAKRFKKRQFKLKKKLSMRASAL